MRETECSDLTADPPLTDPLERGQGGSRPVMGATEAMLREKDTSGRYLGDIIFKNIYFIQFL